MRYIVFTLLALNLVYLGLRLLPEETVDEAPRVQEPDVPTIQLLREAGDDVNRKQQLDQVVMNPVRMVESAESECTAIGPFTSVTQGQMVLERLEALEVPVELRAIDEIMGEFDYRVMIAPAVSLEVAFRNLRELQSQDIDSYVITQGANSLGISLGVFSNLESAGRMREDMTAAGYKVDIVDMARLTRSYWIFSSEDPHLLVGEDFLEMLRLEIPDVAENAQMCVRKGGPG
ncbi:MAG: hypothetical protein HN708_16970 [Candidatus Marinimicrobia bacterium]|nr:hypothetical protein [Candidatus Neomarinimicrobiota bacterium]